MTNNKDAGKKDDRISLSRRYFEDLENNLIDAQKQIADLKAEIEDLKLDNRQLLGDVDGETRLRKITELENGDLKKQLKLWAKLNPNKEIKKLKAENEKLKVKEEKIKDYATTIHINTIALETFWEDMGKILGLENEEAVVVLNKIEELKAENEKLKEERDFYLGIVCDFNKDGCIPKSRIEKAIEEQILKAKKSITDYQDDVQKEIVEDIILHLNNLKKELLHSEKDGKPADRFADESAIQCRPSEKCERLCKKDGEVSTVTTKEVDEK